MESLQQLQADHLLIGLSVATLIVAFLAALYSWLSYRLKQGIEVRGSYTWTSSIAAEDRYVSQLTLENLKDRAVVIFKVFLELSHGYYLEIERFEPEPLVLPPFEAFRKTYDPIDHYSVSMKRIKLDKLLSDDGIRRRLVLATSQGRYNVSDWIERWDPVGDFFKNHLTAIIHAQRSTFQGESYGSGTKYVLQIKRAGHDDEVIPIYPGDHRVKKFRTFRLTPDSLESKEALEHFLLERALDGELTCTDFEVFDLEEWRTEAYEDLGEPINALPRSWVTYHLLGWLLTKKDRLELWWKNRATRTKREREMKARRGVLEKQEDEHSS